MKIIVALLSLNLLIQVASFAQNQKVVVVKDQSGKPISGASVTIGEAATPVTTNEKGEFPLQIESSTPVLIEADGYNSQIVTVSPGKMLEGLVLVKAPYQMGDKDMVNVPFGTFTQRQIPGAVVAINPRDIIKYDREGSFSSLLNGRVPGLFGSTNNRQSGGSMLVVVDGVPRPGGDYNLEQIEQITVLKDLSSILLYGAQASSGVILITTKRGEPLKKTLRFTVENGFNTPISYPKYLAAGDYMPLYNEALANDGIAPKYSAAQIDSTQKGVNPVRFPDEGYYNSKYLKDWYNSVNVVGEASGGNERAQYYLNLGWNRNGSILKIGEGGNQKTNQLSLRANVNYKVTDDIKLTFDAATVFKLSTAPRYSTSSDFWGLSTTLKPDNTPVLIPASLMQDQALLGAAKLIDGKYLLGGTSQYPTNIYGELTLNGPRKTNDRMLEISTGLDFDLSKITPGLKASAYMSFDMYSLFIADIMNTYAVYQPVYAADAISRWNKYNTDAKVQNQTLADVNFYRRTGLYGKIDYNRIFNNDHEITINGIGYRDQYSTEGLSQMTKHLQFGIRANYTYKNKYVAEVTGVAVGSVKLYNTDRWGYSKGAGLGWIVSEEGFLKNNSLINYLKVRANWAINNSDEGLTSYNLGSNLYTSSSSYPYFQGAYTNASLILQNGNPKIGFEKQMNINLGFESRLMDYNLGIEASYFYYKNYDDAIIRLNTLPAYLEGVPYENFGSSQAQGVEVGLNYRHKIGDLEVKAGANFTYSVPKLLKVDELNYAESYRTQQGKPTDAIFGFVSLGLFKDQADIDASVPQTFGTVKPGDIKYKDLNNDNQITDLDQQMIGNSSARVQYGLNLELKYKSFELFALGTGQTGSERSFTNAYYWVYGERKYSEVVLDRWTPATAATATYPRLTTLSSSNNFRNSTFWLNKYNWFNLSTVQLTYSLPKLAGVEGMRLFVRGNNLTLLSKLKDKAQRSIGTAPQIRFVSIGLSLGL